MARRDGQANVPATGRARHPVVLRGCRALPGSRVADGSRDDDFDPDAGFDHRRGGSKGGACSPLVISAGMQRGVYFDAWFPRQHCYHPSLPPRRLTMVDDLAEYRATTLVWSALGGGSISLPYLEQEAFGEIDARSRLYGFVNDAEFIAACRVRGIQVFGVVFEVQGW